LADSIAHGTLTLKPELLQLSYLQIEPMAKAIVHTNPVVHLELSLEEAFWLKSHTQSFLGPEPKTEDNQRRRIRSAIFEALPSFDDLS